MNFLFTYVAMYTGGIETLILRMSEWLINNDHKVDLLLIRNEGELLPKINPDVNVISFGEFTEINFVKFCNNKSKSKNYDVIYSFSPLTTWMSLLLRSKMRPYPIVLNGVYHLYDYKLFGDKYTQYIFNKILPDRCKIFMTQTVREEHEIIFKRKFANSVIWPLPINISKFENVKRIPKKFKIVSVGRLTSFKTYNIYMLDVVKKLIEANFEVEYYIYGTGDLLLEIEAKIIQLQLMDHVFLKGTIDYDQMSDAFKDAYVSIGMGTSIIEAGLCKVPSIVAIAYSKSAQTHGYIHDLPNYNCGELIANYPLLDLFECFKKLFSLNDTEYLQLSNKSYAELKSQYDINKLMKNLFSELDAIKKDNIFVKEINAPYNYIGQKSIRKLKAKVIRSLNTVNKN